MKPTFRCSSLDRILSCHGSHAIEAALPKQNDSGHAVQWAGSWCHHQAARRFKEEFGAVGEPDPLTIPASFVPSSYDEWTVDWYVSRATSIIPSNWAMFIEREIIVEFPRFFLSGHIDLLSIDPTGTKGIVDDLKRGYEVVDHAENNWQLAGYLVLAADAVPTLEELLLHIHQPSAPDRTTEAVVRDVKAVRTMLESRINAMLDDHLTLTTGKACKYCPGAVARISPTQFSLCPTLKKDIISMQETLSEKDFISHLANFSNVQDLGDLANHARKLQYPVKRLIDTFKVILEEQGGEVELCGGVVARIVEEEGNREITDPQFAHSQLTAKVGAPAAWGTLSIGMGKIEEALAASGMQKSSKKKEVETVKTWVDANLGGVITRKKQKTLTFA